MTWHLLQISDVLDMEFGSALTERVPLIAWEPVRTFFPWLHRDAASAVEPVADPPLQVRRFPLLRGYARLPTIARVGPAISALLLRHTSDPAHSPLICTIPYFAPVAEHWPGPVIYWLTDLMESYNDVNAEAVHRLDERMCRAATLVCPNSRRLADYLIKQGHCPSSKIRILPNATRASNLLPEPPEEPSGLPEDIADLPRPVAGVIGNLAGNMDWLFLERLMKLSPGINWAFVGPTTMAIPDTAHSRARDRLMQMPNARFTGQKAYGALAGYARSFDIAVLPYRRVEPTYSGSSTRFYEHLAACRPMIATPGLEELTRKEPLLRLVETAEEAARVMAQLRSLDFVDGFAKLRWKESHDGTWQARAAFLEQELYACWSAGLRARKLNGSENGERQTAMRSGLPLHLSPDIISRG